MDNLYQFPKVISIDEAILANPIKEESHENDRYSEREKAISDLDSMIDTCHELHIDLQYILSYTFEKIGQILFGSYKLLRYAVYLFKPLVDRINTRIHQHYF